MTTSLVLPNNDKDVVGGLKPLVMLWATPRSVSTAFERVMKNSPELDIVHEPFSDTYHYSEDRRSCRYGDWDKQPALANAAVVNATLLDMAKSKRVFVKELAFQGEAYANDQVYAQSHHLIITRNPNNVYKSLIKLKPDFTEDEFGFTALFRVYSRIRCMSSNVFVVDGDQFSRHPEKIVETTCSEIGINYKPTMLQWDDGKIRDWSTSEAQSQAKWHRTLEKSTTISPTSAEDVNIEVASSHHALLKRAHDVYEILTGN